MLTSSPASIAIPIRFHSKFELTTSTLLFQIWSNKRANLSVKIGSKSQEFASFESKSSDLVHGGGGGEPQPDVCAAQSIDDTGVLVSFRARKDTHNHQQENSEQIPMETLDYPADDYSYHDDAGHESKQWPRRRRP